MSSLERPARQAHNGSTSMPVKGLLACGILSSLLWPVSSEVLAAWLYEGYSPFSQAVSELTSIGAPTRPPLIVEGFVYSVLVIAFGIGVWQSAQGKRTLRVTAGVLVAYGAVGPLWLPFPMTARADIQATTAVTDVMHMVLSGVDVLLMLTAIGFGAAALGKWFRLYSILTAATVLVFGALTGTYVPRIAAGEATPWLGVVERISLGAWLLWVAVLAIAILRRGPARTQAAPETAIP